MNVLPMTLDNRVLARPVARDGPLEALVRRLQRGDEAAMEPFVEATQKLAFKVAWHLLRDYHGAQDVLQESYLAAFRTVRGLRDPAAASGWFLRIVSNRCIGVIRKQQVRPEAELPEDLIDEACLQERSGDRLVLRQALQSLTPSDRQVLILRAVLDLPYEDVSTVLGVPLGTVKSRLSEARRRLAHKLSKEDLS